MNPVPITDLPQRQQDFRTEDLYLLDCKENKHWSHQDIAEDFEKRYGKKLTASAVQGRVLRAVERRVGGARWDLQDVSY